MPTSDTQLQQLVINVGTTAQLEAAMQGGTITSDMLSISTDGATYSGHDNKSITQNSSDELQTVGVIDQNATTTAIKTWTGTKAQYDALLSGGTVDNNTLYNITDDANPVQNLLETIYPVGSIYIGTMAVCPLSALFGTWELVAGGRVLQGSDSNHLANTTIEAGLPNITGDAAASSGYGVLGSSPDVSGCFKGGTSTGGTLGGASVAGRKLDFDASLSNSIYGNSNTVQPPAFVVNIWKRTA